MLGLVFLSSDPGVDFDNSSIESSVVSVPMSSDHSPPNSPVALETNALYSSVGTSTARFIVSYLQIM